MKTTLTSDKQCCVCSRKLIGRKDKVYCDNRCKYLHHKAARKQIITKFKYNSKRELRNLITLEGIFGIHRKEFVIHKNLLFKYGFDLFCFFKNTKEANHNHFKIKKLPNNLISIKRKDDIDNFAFDIFQKRWNRIFPANFEQKSGSFVDGVTAYFKDITLLKEPILTVKLLL